MYAFINACLGGALLLAGRRIFWLFVGMAGFVTGLELTTRFFHGPEAMAIVVGLLIGLIFALLAVFLQTIAIGIAGFLAGGYVLLALAALFGLDKAPLVAVIYLVGGIIGVLLVSFLFDWAIITLSSLAGATLIVQAFRLQRAADGFIFLILFLAGVAIQGTALRNQEQHTPKES